MNPHTDHRVLLGLSTLGFLTLTLIVAIVPAAQIQKTRPAVGMLPLSAAAADGRRIYIREGCGFCHTQFVRDLELDRPYGRGSLVSDYANERPPMLGTQRTGPDLANAGSRQSSELWHLIHLYDPRSVVPQSVMPAYPWYFELKNVADPGDLVVPVPRAAGSIDGIVVARYEAVALTRYIQSLQQPNLPDGP